ncbi:hypothetical protein ACFE04_011846 [Oxalis oulophora]
MEQSNERIGSRNPSQDPDAPQPKTLSAKFTPYYPLRQRNISYPGYGGGAVVWNQYPQQENVEGFNITPIMFGDIPPSIFHTGFSVNPELPYGPYPAYTVPLSPIMVEGHIYSPTYIPNVRPPFQGASSEPGSSYLVPVGSFSPANLSGNTGSSPLPSPNAHPPQPVGILGSYKQSVAHRVMQGVGFPPKPSTSQYPHGGSNQTSNFGRAPVPYAAANGRITPRFYKGRGQERGQGIISTVGDSYDADTNRGPRVSKPKGKTTIDNVVLSATRDYSGKNFALDFSNAKFFIIKSFNEDNVHRSIKYNVWSSTTHGNMKLDDAYNKAKDMAEKQRIFMLFSVNASGQFCGLAEMIGPVDFKTNADHWFHDNWSGQFPVQWHMIKDVPNTQFRHIILRTNDYMPVTHSRDSQELNFEHGIEMLKIFKDYDARTSLFDDFDFYNEREDHMLKKKKMKKLVSLDDKGKKKFTPGETAGGSKLESSVSLVDNSIKQILENFLGSLVMEEGKDDKKVTVMAIDATIEDDNVSSAID